MTGSASCAGRGPPEVMQPGELAFWPPGAPREESVEAFTRMYELLGFAECETAELEPEYEKIALFAVGDRPKHAARQLPHGSWTSKLGKDIDIEHALSDIEGELYGQVVRILKRPSPVEQAAERL